MRDVQKLNLYNMHVLHNILPGFFVVNCLVVSGQIIDPSSKTLSTLRV